MSRNYPVLLALIAITLFLPSCEVIGDIFKAGMWTSFIIIFVVIALIIWIISRFSRRR